MKTFKILGQWLIILIAALFCVTMIRAIFVLSSWVFGSVGSVVFLALVLITASINGAINAK